MKRLMDVEQIPGRVRTTQTVTDGPKTLPDVAATRTIDKTFDTDTSVETST